MKINDEAGSAVIEFVLFAVVLQIGLLIYGLQLFGAQSSQLAAESAARHSLRSFILTGTNPEDTAIQVLKDFGMSKKVDVNFTCDPDCNSAGSLVAVKIDVGNFSAVSKAVR